MKQHSDMVNVLIKKGSDIKSEMTDDEANILHMVIGISGEAGELLDAIKKNVIYRKPLDVDNVIEELGDLEFYMEGLRQALDITRKECLEENIRKLRVRYNKFKYTNTDAVNRKDKQ